MHRLNALNDRTWPVLSAILFGCLGLVILTTFLHYGLTYDEEVGRFYGRHILKWYATFFKDQSALSYYDLYLYGGFFETTAQLMSSLVRGILPIGVYETRHLITALFGLTGVWGAYKLANHVSGPRAGFFSALFLTVTPGFYGHIFNNSKDIPFAALSSLALYCIFRTYRQLPSVSKSLTATLGITIGLALGVRIGAIILIGYTGLFWATWLAFQWARRLQNQQQIFVSGVRLACTLAVIAGIAWLVMLIWWPWAQVSPLKHPYDAIRVSAHFDWRLNVFFDGRFLAGTALPWAYLPTWFMISLPEFYFIALATAPLLLWKSRVSLMRGCNLEATLEFGLLGVTCCFPVLTAILLHSTMYDGMRQFLFVLPSVTALAGISFASFLNSRINRSVKALVITSLCAALIITLWDMVQMHPYEYVYFNRLFAGGMKSAAERFETDYWGSSYKEGAEWVIKNYQPRSKEIIRVANCEVGFLIRQFFKKGDPQRKFKVVGPSEHPDVYLAITRWQCHKLIDGKVLHTVQRKGIPLLYILEVNGEHHPEVSRKIARPPDGSKQD